MTSLMRWMTGRDERPSVSQPSQVARRHNDTNLVGARRSNDPDSVTYASRDPKRNVQFVCHLPEGSPLAEQAQKIAGAVYSGRSAEAPQPAARLLRDRSEQEPAAKRTGGLRGERHGHTRGRSFVESDDDSESENEEEEEMEIPRQRLKRKPASPPSRHAAESKVDVVRKKTTNSHNAKIEEQPAGFRHQSDTHVTYNIKQRGGGCHLFVSAPVGSNEAKMHDQVAAKAGVQASKLIEDGNRHSAVGRRG